MSEQKVVKLTPKWAGLMPALIQLAAQGDKDAKEELMNLARMADDINTRSASLKG